MLDKFPVTLANRNISWSKLSHYLRLAYRMCHNEAVNIHQMPTDSTAEFSRTVGRLPDDQYRMFLMKPNQPRTPKILRVSIIGEPNSGKSTLVNRLMGWKVNAVSSRVHTTRKNTSGILTEGDTQIVFVDTPGVITAFQRKRHHCDPNMLTDPEQSLHEVDAVGVVVDVANKWTRTTLNREVLKILHLHPDTPSFLILNKVDALKKRSLLLETTRRLTCGVVAGNKMTFPDKVKGQRKDTMINMNDKYFEKLEQRYGKLKCKKKTSSSMFWNAYQQKLADMNEEFSDSEENTECSFSDVGDSEMHTLVDTKDSFDVETDAKQEMFKVGADQEAFKLDTDKHDIGQEISEIQKMADMNKESSGKYKESSSDKKDGEIHIDTEGSVDAKQQTLKVVSDQKEVTVDIEKDDVEQEIAETSDGIELEQTYQSDFLARLRATAAPSNDTQQNWGEEPDFSWTERMKRIQEARNATGWARFDRVFMVSALEGDGMGDIQNYLFDIAKPGNWEFNSCLVTPQHPHDIAKMCVWQCLLDVVPDWLPYSAQPEVVYWNVDQYDRLDIVVEVTVDCQLPRFIGVEGQNVKKISDQARQALLDAFQCEISFKLAFRQRSRRAQKQR